MDWQDRAIGEAPRSARRERWGSRRSTTRVGREHGARTSCYTLDERPVSVYTSTASLLPPLLRHLLQSSCSAGPSAAVESSCLFMGAASL